MRGYIALEVLGITARGLKRWLRVQFQRAAGNKTHWHTHTNLLWARRNAIGENRAGLIGNLLAWTNGPVGPFPNEFDTILLTLVLRLVRRVRISNPIKVLLQTHAVVCQARRKTLCPMKENATKRLYYHRFIHFRHHGRAYYDLESTVATRRRIWTLAVAHSAALL